MFTFNCPLAPSNQVNAPIWGTDIYTLNSGLCTAAVHAGIITTDGGLIDVELNPAESIYQGSDRFGINSNNYQREINSIRFIGQPVAIERNQEPNNAASSNRDRRRPSSVERTVGNGVRTVSYTHLTLPTIYSV